MTRFLIVPVRWGAFLSRQSYIISKRSPNFMANCCDIWAQLASGIVHFSRMFRYAPDTQAFREKYRTGKLLCSLLPYVLACGSLQPCWWCISAYVSQVYTGSIPWGAPSCHAMILWRWDTFPPTCRRVCPTVFLQTLCWRHHILF